MYVWSISLYNLVRASVADNVDMFHLEIFYMNGTS